MAMQRVTHRTSVPSVGAACVLPTCAVLGAAQGTGAGKENAANAAATGVVGRMKAATKYRSGKSDGDLLIAAGSGDRRALDELYLGYQWRLALFLSRFTRCPENVEEIINDTFMVVWRHANDFRFASQVSSWIFGIAQRTALKSIRRERKYAASRCVDECPEQTVDPMLETEVQDWVMHGLNRLPEEQAVTLQLACHIGHSLAEIAEITCAPVGTVKARMFHARKKLRRHLRTLGGILDSPASAD